MEKVIGDQGVVLMGEAAKAYVQFKYTELYWMVAVLVLFIVVLGLGLWGMMRD